MSAFTDISDKIQQTEAEIRDLEAVVARYPERRTLAMTLESMQKRQKDLQADYTILANQAYLDVCRYRLFSLLDADKDAHPPIVGLANALGRFQDAVTLVYAALKDGAKQRAAPSIEAAEATRLRYAYSFAGSVGFGMTLANERVLLEETLIEESVRIVFQIARATTAEQIAEYAQTIGPAPIRVIYEWAHAHAQADLGADIDWHHDDNVLRLFMSASEMQDLQEVISQTSEENVEEMTYTGTLVAADIEKFRFRLTFPNGDSIGGKAERATLKRRDVILGRKYVARLRKTTRVDLATGAENIYFLLLDLSDPQEALPGLTDNDIKTEVID